jgi:lipopolysaccharide export LptBFGC system permease protein LptF
MKTIVRAALAAVLVVSFAGAAVAQQKAPAAAQKAPANAKQAPAPAPAQDAAPPQIALTEQQVQGFITATPEIAKITGALQAEPDKKTQDQLDALAKKAGFSGFEEYGTVSANVSMVLQGIDPQTKKFGDPKAMMQKQIAEVQADKKMKPAEKKEALAELNQALKEVQPIKNQGNIALVEKNYDKIAPLMQE